MRLKTIKKGWSTEGDKLLEFLVCVFLRLVLCMRALLTCDFRKKGFSMRWRSSIFVVLFLLFIWLVITCVVYLIADESILKDDHDPEK